MPKVVDHALRRREILGACFELFARRGYGTVTMRQLAQEAGVSTGTLYHYFDGKRGLFEAMFEEMTRRDIQAAAAGIGEEMSIPERFEALRSFLDERAEALIQALLVALDYQRQRRNADFLARRLRDYGAALTQQLELDEQTSRLVLSFVLGALVHKLLDPEAEAVGDQVAAMALLVQPRD